MSIKCQAPTGCDFYGQEGRRYCSRHFQELATEEEKNAANAAAAKRVLEIQQARTAWNQALEGSIADARDAILAVKAMPGFSVSYIEEEIFAIRNSRNLNRVLRLAEAGEEILYRGRQTMPAVLMFLLDYEHTYDDPLFDEILNHPSITAETLDLEIMQSEIYNRWRDIRLLEKILRKGKVTKELVEAAKFSVKRPHNVPSPSQNLIVKLVQDLFKAEQMPSESKESSSEGRTPAVDVKEIKTRGRKRDSKAAAAMESKEANEKDEEPEVEPDDEEEEEEVKPTKKQRGRRH